MGWESAWEHYRTNTANRRPYRDVELTPMGGALFQAGYETAAAEYRAVIREALAALKDGQGAGTYQWALRLMMPDPDPPNLTEERHQKAVRTIRALAALDALAGEEATDAPTD